MLSISTSETMVSQLLIVALAFFVCFTNGLPVIQDHDPITDSLQLLHVVFRHGDRTQDGTYPNDPYQNETFWPVGVGQLTNAGKLREYNIGVYLKNTYGDFIGDTYFPGILQANSSYYPRTKASLQLVLAGLFPPENNQRWSLGLDWQPIPYDYLPMEQNYLFWSRYLCSKYDTYFAKYVASEANQNIYAPYSNTLDYLQQNSGLSSKVDIALSLYSTLKSQQEWGLQLPEWSDSVWPEPISAITKLDWHQMYGTDELRALGAGFLMSKIVNDTQLTIDEDQSVEDTKIYLYSGHDTNIAAVLSWIGVADLHVPQYGSFIVFEIHREHDISFVRVVHQNYEYDTPQHVEIPGCGFDCPFDTFVNLYSNYLNPYEICN